MTSVICGISRFGPKAPFVMRSKELAVMPAKAEGIGGLDRDEEADAVRWLLRLGPRVLWVPRADAHFV